MRRIFRDNAKTIVVAMVTAMVTAIGAALVFNVAPAIAHGVKHAKYAHNADKVDGKHANQLRSIAEGRSFSYQDGAPFQTVAATPENILEFQFKAPRKGFAEVSYAHADFANGASQVVISWIEVDPVTDCNGDRLVEPTEMFNSVVANGYGNSSATAVIPVTKGTHTAILCVQAEATGVDVGIGSLNATFVPAGQVSIAVPPAPRSGSGSRFGR